MLQLSNPRLYAEFENWPSGSRRVNCVFEVESNKKGSRVSRTTTGKPKRTTYYTDAVIVDGDDGKTYVLAFTCADQCVVIESGLKYTQYFYPGSDEYNAYSNLFNTMEA